MQRPASRDMTNPEGVYVYAARQMRRRLGQIYRTTAAYLICAVLLLIATTYANRMTVNNVLLAVLREGINIGAWVFAWECISGFLFDHRRVRLELHRLLRFKRALLCFTGRPAPYLAAFSNSSLPSGNLIVGSPVRYPWRARNWSVTYVVRSSHGERLKKPCDWPAAR